MSTSPRNSGQRTAPDLDSIRRELGSGIDARAGNSDKTESAVLVLIHGRDDPSVVMTVKPRSMREHAGEVAFPGGKLEAGDEDLLATALREAREELGIEARRDEIVGQLRPVSTLSSGYVITPFVLVHDRLGRMAPNSEVDEILCMPLAPLLRTCRTAGPLGLSFTYGRHTVWGASARILQEVGRKTGLA